MALFARSPCDLPPCQTVASAAAKRNRTWVLVAAIGGSSMGFIDGTAVNVMLPVLQRDVGASAGEVQWIVEGYSLLLSSLILAGGALGDRVGRRRVFASGISLFTLCSLACAVSPDASLLIAFRCLQGIGAALAIPGSLALITAAFPEEDRGGAIGTWSAFSAVTSALGPVLGGWLSQTVSWRAVFLINLPIAFLVAVALSRVSESRDTQARQIDIVGTLLATAGLGALVFGLIAFQTERAAPPATSIALGFAFLAIFVVYERRWARYPMLPADLLTSLPFAGANLYTALLYAALGGGLYFVPFDLINVHRYSPTAAGAALLPFIVIMFAASHWSGGLVSHIGARLPLVVGACFAATGFYAFSLPGFGGRIGRRSSRLPYCSASAAPFSSLR